jgi:hypothetical protein
MERLLDWMVKQDFAHINAGEPSLLRQVEDIVIESHRLLYEAEGRSWSKAIAYRWLRFEDPLPVARLRDGLKELRRRGANIEPDAVDKVCKDAAKHGFSY